MPGSSARESKQFGWNTPRLAHDTRTSNLFPSAKRVFAHMIVYARACVCVCVSVCLYVCVCAYEDMVV
jgi:hypothetical protein